ncbi:hypothetical protein I4F81_006909 [Pyropia yezoensis]|uniref:Uncharacterized protein n=1 Tax=Pyropia yezoensis TaxID=2788 RepID=A0ACC3C250_PYRYE|nr:hypothetical protein I4F81_006909 [Neopyropia yezoensis]
MAASRGPCFAPPPTRLDAAGSYARGVAAGRYMAAFRAYSEKYPFRLRSETPEIAIELSLQPYRAYGVDATIMFSDILTPLPALGVEFDVVPGKGPVIASPLRDAAAVAAVVATPLEPSTKLPFVGETLRALRRELETQPTAVMGFVGAPFTLAAYAVEGRADKHLKATKGMMASADGRAILHGLLAKLATSIGEYAVHQVDAGAHAVQLFDSWAHHLSPADYRVWALPYARTVAAAVRAAHPGVPVFFFANGSAGKLEDIAAALGNVVDVVSLDWGVGMAAGRERLGRDIVAQGNSDPMVLYTGDDVAVRAEVDATCAAAGRGHILNLGHGVMQGTPESAVGVYCDAARAFQYAERGL